MFENVQFFRFCILRFQKVLLLKNINMGIKKRRCLCWFQIRCCRLKQMPIKKLEPKNYSKFEYLFSCLCIFSWFFASDLCGLMISEMTLSNQSHFPRFFSPRKMTYRGLTNSGLRQAGIACPRKMTLGSWLHQILFADLARWLSGDKPILASHKLESDRPR